MPWGQCLATQAQMKMLVCDGERLLATGGGGWAVVIGFRCFTALPTSGFRLPKTKESGALEPRGAPCGMFLEPQHGRAERMESHSV
jgi:hypothetical protein